MSTGNPIREWSWTPPTEAGLYLVCFGDVETPYNMNMVHFKDLGSGLQDGDGDPPSHYGSSYKWARLLVGSEIEG